MKKIIPITVFLVAIVSFCGMTQVLNLDEVLAKYYQAVGMDKLREWKTLVMTCKSTVQGIDYPITIITKRPGKIRFETEIQGNKMIQAFDGQAGWSIVPWSGSSDPQDMTPDEIKGMKDQADIDGALYNWKEKGHKVELIGKEDMEGTPVYKIKVTKANGDIETDFIDAESFVPIKVSAVTKIQGNETEGEGYPSNYKEVNGVMMPFSIENKVKGETVSLIVMEKYEVNKDLDDNLFAKPAKKK